MLQRGAITANQMNVSISTDNKKAKTPFSHFFTFLRSTEIHIDRLTTLSMTFFAQFKIVFLLNWPK